MPRWLNEIVNKRYALLWFTAFALFAFSTRANDARVSFRLCVRNGIYAYEYIIPIREINPTGRTATRQTPVVTIPRSFLFREIRFPLSELIFHRARGSTGCTFRISSRSRRKTFRTSAKSHVAFLILTPQDHADASRRCGARLFYFWLLIMRWNTFKYLALWKFSNTIVDSTKLTCP